MNKVLVCGLTSALLVTAACSSASNTPTVTTKATPPAATAVATTTPAAATTGAQDFTLLNETGVEIDKVYIAPHESDDWEEDILGQDTLPSGQKVEIKFNRDEKAALWDLRVEDSKENSIEWENLNLLQISKLTLHYKDGKATAVAE